MPKKTEKVEQEKRYQAVVIVENLQNPEFFACLTPCPIESPLESSINQLIRNNITDIFVFTSEHEREVKEFLEKKDFRAKIQVVSGQDCKTFASILHVFYTRKLLEEDFLVISSHLVTDWNFGDSIKNFEQITQKNKGLLMMESLLRDSQQTG